MKFILNVGPMLGLLEIVSIRELWLSVARAEGKGVMSSIDCVEMKSRSFCLYAMF